MDTMPVPIRIQLMSHIISGRAVAKFHDPMLGINDAERDDQNWLALENDAAGNRHYR